MNPAIQRNKSNIKKPANISKSSGFPPLFRATFSIDLLPALMRSKMATILMSIFVIVSARNVCAQQVITFNDRNSLAALFYRPQVGFMDTAARWTMVG
jgi:hypothetical protein